MENVRENVENKGRNVIVDFLRGIAVIGVLLGHALQRGLYPIDFNTVGLTKFIYAWHMPLFILLSGYTMCISLRRKGKISIWSKFKRLVLPTFVWSFIIYFVHDFEFVGIKWFRSFDFGIVEYMKMLVACPTYIVWFLWVVFVCTLVVYGSHLIVKKIGEDSELLTLIFSSFIFLGWATIVAGNVLGTNYIKQYYGFFLVGYACACIKNEKITDAVKGIFLLLLIYYVIFKLVYGIETEFPSQLMAYLMMALLYFIAYACQKLMKISENNIICWLGRNSLYIYLYQFLCLNIGIGTGIVRVISIFCTATGISVLLTLVLNRGAKVRALLFGEF